MLHIGMQVRTSQLAAPSLVLGGVGHVCQQLDGLGASLAVYQLQVAADEVFVAHVPLVISLHTGILRAREQHA